MDMKKVLQLCIIFCFCESVYGQNVVRYSYDATGNRIKKEIVLSKEKMNESDTDEQSYSDMLDKHDIQIYPNPTEGDLTINISNMNSSNQVSIMLYEVNGSLVKQQKVENGQTRMDIRDKVAGIYMMQINIDGKSTT